MIPTIKLKEIKIGFFIIEMVVTKILENSDWLLKTEGGPYKGF